MNLNDIAKWMHEMQELTGGCVLEMRAYGRSGIELELSWRKDGHAVSHSHRISGLELRQMDVSAQKQVMQQIRHRVSIH